MYARIFNTLQSHVIPVQTVLAGTQLPWIKWLRQHVVDDPFSLRLLYQILLKLGERKLLHELVHGGDGTMPGVETYVGGGVVAQLDKD